jgi:hypothetical protein
LVVVGASTLEAAALFVALDFAAEAVREHDERGHGEEHGEVDHVSHLAAIGRRR